MKFKTGFLVGAALGYYYGAKAGRERYEQIDRLLARVREHPTYRSAADSVGERVEQVQGQVRERVEAVAGDAISSVRSSRQEPEWEPGLEFNPDYRPTEEDLLADFRGESPPNSI